MNITYWLIIQLFIVLIIVILLMFMTATTDPGMIPRVLNNTNLRRKNLWVNHLGYLKKLKICETCLIVKPFRSNHCRDCNNCVEKFDHHCPWIGCCIGFRNYKLFYIFILSLNIYLIDIIVLCSYKLSKTNVKTINQR